MNWVLWREYRLNRWIFVFAAMVLVSPYIAVALMFGYVWATEGGFPSVAEGFGGAALVSFAATQVTLAILGGNAIAGERADRSAEFMACLPVPRTRRLRSKLTLASFFVLVSWGVSASVIGGLLLFDAEMAEILQLPEFPIIVLAAVCSIVASLATYSLCLLISSFTSNPAFAVAGGLMTAAIAAIIAVIYAEEPKLDIRSFLICYTIVALTVGVACFWIGTRHYLNRVEP